MVIGQRQGGSDATTGGLPFHLGRLSLRARAWLAACFVLAAAGCASPERLASVPAADVLRALPLGLANARFYPEDQPAELLEEFLHAIQRQRHALGLGPDAQLPPAELLALSGGGGEGAFGSGLLVGWTEAGDRPDFEVVTGVSTGALLAPFAFLGPDYDRPLRDVFTTVSTEDIFIERGFIDAITNDALADTTPLWNLISKYFDESMMTAIASEYQKGRLLLILTTNLDAQRPTIWNIGAISASGHPGALDLVRKILRASSAVPGFFQPVLIDVEVDGKRYQELHVDGGIIALMFLYPPNIDRSNIAHRERKVYLIENARKDPEWANVEPTTVSIASRAIDTVIHYTGMNDLLRLYYTTQADGIDYNLAYIGADFNVTKTGEFDKPYMNAVFDYGYEQSRRGYPWRKTPPFAQAKTETE
jgi:hypothetical protein